MSEMSALRAPIQQRSISEVDVTEHGTVQPERRADEMFECDSNALAIRVLNAFVEEKPNRSLASLFIWGPLGVGKTTLLERTALRLRAKGSSVALVEAETFTNEFVQSCKHGRMSKFRGLYRSADVLIIDALEFFENGNKKATLDEIEHTIRFVTADLKKQAGNGLKRLVIGSNVHPRDSRLPERLRSVLLGLAAIEIEEPTPQQMFDFVRWLEEGSTLQLTSDNIWQLVSCAAPSFREVFGLFQTVRVTHEFSPGRIRATLVEKALGNTTKQREPSDFGKLIAKMGCDRLGITEKELQSDRSRRVAIRRHAICYAMYTGTELSYEDVADVIGKHHSSVMHGCTRIRKLLAKQQKGERLTQDERLVCDFVRRIEREI